jgi:hypothetical protein
VSDDDTTIQQSVSSTATTVFSGEEAKKYSETYLAELLVTWRDIEKGVSRNLVLLLLAGAAGVLVGRHQVAALSLGFIKVTNIGWLTVAIPVVFAYLYSSLWSLASESAVCRGVFDGVTRAIWPAASAAKLEMALYPYSPLPSKVKTETLLSATTAMTPTSLLVSATNWVKVLILLLAPLGVEGYLFYLTYQEFGAHNALLWVSATISTLLLVAGLTHFSAAAELEA